MDRVLVPAVQLASGPAIACLFSGHAEGSGPRQVSWLCRLCRQPLRYACTVVCLFFLFFLEHKEGKSESICCAWRKEERTHGPLAREQCARMMFDQALQGVLEHVSRVLWDGSAVRLSLQPSNSEEQPFPYHITYLEDFF